MSKTDANNAGALLRAIAQIQAEFILSGQTRESFDPLLAKLLELTESEYGFIGEVLTDENGSPYLKTHALTNIAWNEETREFYDENAPNGLEFRNLNSLFGYCLKHARPVLSEDPENDSRRGGLPPGHPPLLKFAGLPIYQGSEMVGMIGLANRPGGYDQALVEFLQPFLTTCATLIVGFRTLSREREQERLRNEQERKTATIVNTAVDAIVTIDEDGRIETFNQGAEKMFGYTSAELVGANVNCLMPEPYHSDHNRHLQKYLDTGVSRIIGAGREVAALRKDGTVFPVDLSISEINLETRREFVGILRDISERKAAEEQLLEAKLAAEAASRAKSSFLATMSHEIRTPLNAILGMTELLDDTELNDEQTDYVRTLAVSGESLLQLISDFLDLSKIEASQLDITRTNFDLRELIGDTVAVLRPRAQDKGLKLESRISGQMPSFLLGDNNRIRQILLNLLGNAIKFTPAGQVTLEVVFGAADPKQQLPVVFRVSDQGVGIAAADHEQVFEKFFQAGDPAAANPGGTGLGLTICRELARRMGGDVVLEASAPGRGSVFSLTLPLPETNEIDIPAPAPELKETSGTQAIANETASEIRVLLAEDNEDNRKITQRLLEKMGLSVDYAENGETALELVKRTDYDAILMDLDMPVCDGVTATKLIREWERDRPGGPMPIIALTAHALKEYRQRAERAGVSDYITKPVRGQDLQQALLRRIDFRPAVLVVDDNYDARRLTGKMLERTRLYRVSTAASGAEGLDLLERRSFAAVIVDLEMPGMDGLETARRIRQKTGSQPPILALSGHAGSEYVASSRAAGCNAYLTKPADRKTLVDTVSRLISDAGRAPA
ncbi:MAG: response regulator [Xanthomonadales bacterium]|nr:response regulator [Gammaproteobacteria bacterium]MBT8052435.1 response regulator [Gammaproteobacteria bacterium]NNK50537.1 response regulator [Xanthomonadales bacterium]